VPFAFPKYPRDAVLPSARLVLAPPGELRRVAPEGGVGSGVTSEVGPYPMEQLRIDRTVFLPFRCVFLFRLANASILSAIALYVKQLGEARDLRTAVAVFEARGRMGAGMYRGRAIAAGLARERGRFNKRAGFLAIALAVGRVVRPLAGGVLVEHLGFKDL
jgi:hypothetical protein